MTEPEGSANTPVPDQEADVTAEETNQDEVVADANEEPEDL